MKLSQSVSHNVFPTARPLAVSEVSDESIHLECTMPSFMSYKNMEDEYKPGWDLVSASDGDITVNMCYDLCGVNKDRVEHYKTRLGSKYTTCDPQIVTWLPSDNWDKCNVVLAEAFAGMAGANIDSKLLSSVAAAARWLAGTDKDLTQAGRAAARALTARTVSPFRLFVRLAAMKHDLMALKHANKEMPTVEGRFRKDGGPQQIQDAGVWSKMLEDAVKHRAQHVPVSEVVGMDAHEVIWALAIACGDNPSRADGWNVANWFWPEIHNAQVIYSAEYMNLNFDNMCVSTQDVDKAATYLASLVGAPDMWHLAQRFVYGSVLTQSGCGLVSGNKTEVDKLHCRLPVFDTTALALSVVLKTYRSTAEQFVERDLLDDDQQLTEAAVDAALWRAGLGATYNWQVGPTAIRKHATALGARAIDAMMCTRYDSWTLTLLAKNFMVDRCGSGFSDIFGCWTAIKAGNLRKAMQSNLRVKLMDVIPWIKHWPSEFGLHGWLRGIKAKQQVHTGVWTPVRERNTDIGNVLESLAMVPDTEVGYAIGNYESRSFKVMMSGTEDLPVERCWRKWFLERDVTATPVFRSNSSSATALLAAGFGNRADFNWTWEMSVLSTEPFEDPYDDESVGRPSDGPLPVKKTVVSNDDDSAVDEERPPEEITPDDSDKVTAAAAALPEARAPIAGEAPGLRATGYHEFAELVEDMHGEFSTFPHRIRASRGKQKAEEKTTTQWEQRLAAEDDDEIVKVVIDLAHTVKVCSSADSHDATFWGTVQDSAEQRLAILEAAEGFKKAAPSWLNKPPAVTDVSRETLVDVGDQAAESFTAGPTEQAAGTASTVTVKREQDSNTGGKLAKAVDFEVS